MRTLLTIIALALAGPIGCAGVLQVTCEKEYERHLSLKPFSDTAVCDGEVVFEAKGPVASSDFYVTCPEGAPVVLPDGKVTCK